MVLLDNDINFYYSDSIGSVGGNISSIKITTNTLGNLFPDLDSFHAEEGVTAESRCIFLKNDSQTSKTAKITVWIEVNVQSNLTPQKVLFGLGASGINAAELVLPTPFMLPPNVEFIDITSRPEQPQIIKLEPQQRIPIWFNWKVDPEAKSEANLKFTFSAEVQRIPEEVVAPTPTCPTGKVFDPQTGQCVNLPVEECPDGQVFNPVTRLCEEETEIPECPAGQHHNPATNQCEPDVVNPPPAGQIPLRTFAAVGDFDSNSRTDATFTTIRTGLVTQTNNPQNLPLGWLLALGDFSYIDGNQKPFIDRCKTLNDLFPSHIYPVIGNHDDTEDGKASDRTQIITTFGMPSEGYYAFTKENIRFIMLDTQKSIGSSSPQRAFLVQELQAAHANPNILWKFVCYHKPSVTSSGNDHGALQAAIDSFHALFDQYEVDFILSGHNHNSEVTKLVNHSQDVDTPTVVSEGVQIAGVTVYENVKGRIFMVLGGGGRSADSTDADDDFMAFAYRPYATGFFTLKDNGQSIKFALRDSSSKNDVYFMEYRK